jgi:hypothetical protein
MLDGGNDVPERCPPHGPISAPITPDLREMCPEPAPAKLQTAPAWALHNTMTRESRHGTLWKGLTCLFALQLPFAGAQVAEVEKATNASLLWGPYRPNLYFGVRPRIPKSLMGGLMWTRVEDYQSVQHSRLSSLKLNEHQC